MDKVLEGTKMMNGMGDELSTKGFLTEDDKFVVAAQGRFVQGAEWAPTKRGNGSEYRILMRLDMSISHIENGKQGEYLFSYVSGRVLQIKSAVSTRLVFALPFDNESRTTFKNCVVNPKILAATKSAIKFAIADSVKRAENGEAMVTASNSEYIENTQEFLDMAETFAAKKDEKAGGEGSVSEEATQKAAELLGIGK